MHFYIIENDRAPEISGVRSGVGQAWLDQGVFEQNPQIDSFLYGPGSGFRRGSFPEFSLAINNIPMDGNAKLTDIISVVALLSGFVVNQKVVDILNSCNLPEHKFYPVTFKRRKKTIDGYYWFYTSLLNGEKYIDFTKTEFRISREDELDFGGEIKINNYEDYDAVIKK